MKKSVVLLSSGLDSTVNLCCALRETEVVQVITFNYSQKAASKEIERSQQICEKYDLNHKVIDLQWLGQITNTSLVNELENIPTKSEVSIDDYDQSLKTAEAVWVPNRNGVFLNIAAAFADSLGANCVIPGFNKEEAVTFPDNSTDYMKSLDSSFSFSTSNQVEVKCFTDHLNKTEIVQLGRELQAPFELMWSCYFAGDEPCGVCESCQRYKRAMEQ